MSDGPPNPFSVPPGAPSDPERAAWHPGAPAPAPAPAQPGGTGGGVPYPMPAAMPPLGPPYAPPGIRPPDPRYPNGPPEQWPLPHPVLVQPAGQGGPPPGGRPPGGVDRSRWVVIGAIAVVIAVILGVIVAEKSDSGRSFTVSRSTQSSTSSSRGSSSSSSDRGSTTTTTTTTTDPQDLQTVVLAIEKFVERERGLQFKTDVAVKLAGEGEFQDLLLQDFDEERASLIEEGQVLSALGLVPPGTDVVAEMRSLLEIGVVGFYDPKTKQLVVRGTDTTPYVREVLAHELTHALDDQWFDLNRPQLDNADDESGYGFLGLVEGNARRIENAYLGSLSLDEQQQAFQEQNDLLAQHPELFDVPQILITLIQSPYDDGPAFIKAVLADGQPRLDAAFAAPPITSEQILHPDRYLSGQGPVAVPAPASDGPTENVGVLGELMMREMLFDSIGSANQVNRAVDGWGGDKYVTWSDGTGRQCLRDTFVGDTLGDTRELVDSMQQWAQDHGGTVDAADDGSPATLTVCASGGSNSSN